MPHDVEFVSLRSAPIAWGTITGADGFLRWIVRKPATAKAPPRRGQREMVWRRRLKGGRLRGKSSVQTMSSQTWIANSGSLVVVDGSLCGRHKRGWKMLCLEIRESSQTSEPSAKVTVQYGWSVPPWLSLDFGASLQIEGTLVVR